MPAPESVCELVKRFEDNLDSYRSGKYNETQFRRDMVTSFVEWKLELHRASPRLPGDDERVKREIEATDRQIDRLVYELYGLSEDEVKVVDEK